MTTAPTISVIGTGYLGATHAAGLAELGFDVVAVDRDPARVSALAAGDVPFHEPGLAALVAEHVASGRLRFTTDVSAAAQGDVLFVCVGTPQGEDGAADLTQVLDVVDTVVPLLSGRRLLVGKSTVPVGTAELLSARVEGLRRPDAEIELAWNPEFLREGHALDDTLHPSRIVVGTTSAWAEGVLRRIYARPVAEGSPFLVTDLATAELTKMAANAFLATKISFINAMAELCEATGADVTALADALGHDPRIGRRFLDSGLGFGGGCLPKDVRALVAVGEGLGCAPSVGFLREVDAINQRRRDRVVEMAQLAVGAFDGVRIAVLGAAFKPGSDDVRDSPALDVANRLRRAGAYVAVYDPAAALTGRAVAPGVRFAANPVVACRKADLVLHLTEWSEFGELDPGQIGRAVRRKVLIDARNALDAAAWQQAGWVVHAPGRHLDGYRPRRPVLTTR